MTSGRRMVPRLAAVCLGALLWSDLVASPAASPTHAAASMQRGFILIDEASGRWSFRPCGAGATVPIEDRTPGQSLTVAVAEVRRVALDRRRGVFVEFRGTSAPATATAMRFWRALGFVTECRTAPANIAADARLWASGNEPDWRLVVRGRTATLTRSGSERLEIPARSVQTEVRPPPVRAKTGVHVTLDLAEEPCLDTMAEAAFGARVVATVRRDGTTQTLRGCAARF